MKTVINYTMRKSCTQSYFDINLVVHAKNYKKKYYDSYATTDK